MDRGPGERGHAGPRGFFRGELGRLIEYAEHSARLDRPHKDGTSDRQHLEHAARQGDARARSALEGPPFPEALDYLWEWLMELHGRSGAGMGGLAPLSYPAVEAWARLTRRWPEPYEVSALVRLDTVMLNAKRPPKPEKAGKGKS